MKLLEYRSLPAHALRGLIDRRYGIETMEAVSKKELGLGPEQVQYVAVPWLLLGRLLRLLELSSDDVFVDFGSGKGRAVLAAGRYPLARVEGVEISARLHEIAQENLRRNGHRLKCGQIRLVNADARDYDIPPDMTIAFLFNPFKGGVFRAVIDKIIRSIDEFPRPVRLAYVNAFEREALLWTGRARLIREIALPFGPSANVFALDR